jgi:hypothetical protein
MVARHPSAELAIETACQLIDCGCDVYGVGTGPLSDSIARDQIARITTFGREQSIRTVGCRINPSASCRADCERSVQSSCLACSFEQTGRRPHFRTFA